MGELLPLNGGTYYIWKYVPNLAASVIFILIWLILAILLSWRMWKSKTWFCSAFITGCFLEFIGFCARAAASSHTDKLMPYIVQSMMLLLPPTLFAATVYMCLGRIIRLVDGDHLSPISPSKITKIFVSGDLISLFVQSGSAGPSIMTSNPILPKIGQAMVIIGLVMQLLSFGLFFTITIVFHRRIRAQPTARSFAVDASWIQSVYMLYGISVLIIIRSIFRLVEYGAGNDGYPMTHEWMLFVFDTLLMSIATVVFYWRFPDNLKPHVAQGFYMEAGAAQSTEYSKSPVVTTTSRQNSRSNL